MTALTHHPRRALALGVAVAIALLALLPGSWAEAQTGTAGTPPPPITTSCPPGETLVGGICTTPGTPQTFEPDGSGGMSGPILGGPGSGGPIVTACCYLPGETVTVTGTGFEPNEVVTISFSIAPLAARMELNALGEPRVAAEATAPERGELKARQSAAASNYAVVQLLSLFDIEATDANGNPVQPAEPVTMVFDLTPEQLALVLGGDLSTVGLASHNEATDTWEPVACTALGAAQVSCVLPHHSTWALYSVQQVLDGPPPAAETESPPTAGGPAAPSPANTGMGDDDSGATNTVAIILGAAALAGVAGLGGRYAVRRRSA